MRCFNKCLQGHKELCRAITYASSTSEVVVLIFQKQVDSVSWHGYDLRKIRQTLMVFLIKNDIPIVVVANDFEKNGCVSGKVA